MSSSTDGTRRRERRARGAGRRRPRRGRHGHGRRFDESRRRRGAGARGQGDGLSRRELALADGARRAALRRLGVVGSAIGGATQPLLGFLMAEFLVAFFNHSTSHMRREARFWALMFVAMAGCAAIASSGSRTA